MEFIKEFFPRNETQHAITHLETTAYFQGKGSIDDYIDKFKDLIDLSGYTDGVFIVVKFRRGLDPEIQDYIAQMMEGHPADGDIEAWYSTASRCDENRATNAAFHSSSGSTSSISPPLTYTPSLPTRNRFTPLARILDSENELSSIEQEKVLDLPTLTLPNRKRHPKWERRLPSHYVIGSTPGERSLELPVEIQTTDTGQRVQSPALLDCGATGLFADTAFVREKGFTTRTLQRPVPVKNVDGSPNEAGSIKEVVDLVLRFKDHSERALFGVTNLGKQNLILGFPWLRKHNPEVDWKTGDVKMSRCSQGCRTCFLEGRKGKRVVKKKEEKLRVCRSGAMPELIEENEEEPEDIESEWIRGLGEEEEESEWELEEDDRLFYTVLHPETKEHPRVSPRLAEEHIRAYSTISTRLAEAWHKQNDEPKTIPELVPQYLHDFEDVFAKSSFDSLPEHTRWDNGIELIPGAEPSSCKIYPLSPNEQEELDKFLEEHLVSGRIC